MSTELGFQICFNSSRRDRMQLEGQNSLQLYIVKSTNDRLSAILQNLGKIPGGQINFSGKLNPNDHLCMFGSLEVQPVKSNNNMLSFVLSKVTGLNNSELNRIAI